KVHALTNESSKTRHPNTSETVPLANGGPGVHSSANVRHACTLATSSFSDRPCREILDGTAGLSIAIASLENGARSGCPGSSVSELRLNRRHRAGCFGHRGADVAEDPRSPHCARVPCNGERGLDPLSLRIFSVAGSG